MKTNIPSNKADTFFNIELTNAEGLTSVDGLLKIIKVINNTINPEKVFKADENFFDVLNEAEPNILTLLKDLGGARKFGSHGACYLTKHGIVKVEIYGNMNKPKVRAEQKDNQEILKLLYNSIEEELLNFYNIIPQ